MPLPDFASVVPIVRSRRGTGDAAVIVTIVRSIAEFDVRASERMIVAENGTLTGSFPPMLAEQLVADALACLNEGRSRLRSYGVAAAGLVPVSTQQGELDVYLEVLVSTPRLIVVGGGHIAVPLVQVAKILGYNVTVLDDRAEYASPARFPDADTVLHGPYRDTLASLQMDTNTFIVLVTRGHVHDAACLALVIDSPAPYIGMIGSKKRVRTVLDGVLGTNRRPEDADRVYAPIGIDIGSQTPEEIAVAIAAELIKVRRGGKAASLRLGTRERA
jgi:xanthine dehydrogenase accessory factor